MDKQKSTKCVRIEDPLIDPYLIVIENNYFTVGLKQKKGYKALTYFSSLPNALKEITQNKMFDGHLGQVLSLKEYMDEYAGMLNEFTQKIQP